MDYKRIREEMEWKARKQKYKNEKHYEVSLDEIYEVLAEETGIDKAEAMMLEMEIESECCYANPYMKKVIEMLADKGKRLIITSDMYLSADQIKSLLDACGYKGFSSYYVSSEIGKAKHTGDLFDYVKQNAGQDLKYIHVGDNYQSDIEQARKHGFDTHYYKNVNVTGMDYRSKDMSAITGSIYRGMVNAHLHNGLTEYGREYEYGYVYGGLFVTGYCQFINKYVKKNNIDKILFLARDGDVLIKAYNIMFPNDSVQTEYVCWSRLAATKMGARYYKYDYFRRFLFHKMNQKYQLEDIFKTMEIEDMLDDMCSKTNLSSKIELTDNNVEIVKEYLYNQWDTVLEHYEEQLDAGKLYYEKVIGDSKNAVAVDIGWAGSGAIVLNYIVNKVWKLNCPITAIVAGTNTANMFEADASEQFLQSGRMICYMYSQSANRDIWKFHDPAKNHNLFWELLLEAKEGSFQGFYKGSEGECVCKQKDNPIDSDAIEEIQTGILDFVLKFNNIQKSVEKFTIISGRDAYTPMISLESSINKDFTTKLLDLLDNANLE